MGTGELKEQLSLHSFSDQLIEESSKCLHDFIDENRYRKYELIDLVNCIDVDTLNMMSNLLDETVRKLIYEDIDNKSLDIISETLKENTSEWRDSSQRILNITLVKKILENQTYWYSNIEEKLIMRNFHEEHTEDLAFIWLYTLRVKKQKERDKYEKEYHHEL